VTPYFLSEFAIEEEGHRKIRSTGKVFLKFSKKSGSILIIILSRYIDRKTCCYVTCIHCMVRATATVVWYRFRLSRKKQL